MKKSSHKHQYTRIILHDGGNTFSWGKECAVCGRINDTYCASSWNHEDFCLGTAGKHGAWGEICLRAVRETYPEHKIYTLENGNWMPWDASEE